MNKGKPMTIRPYTSNDYCSVKKLFIEVNREFAKHTMQQEFEAYISLALKKEINRLPDFYHTRHGDFWVVIWDNKLIGMFGLETVDSMTAELRRMYVDKKYRRQGIATIMLTHFETECISRGLSVVTLSTSKLQPAAIEFYKAHDYELTDKVIVDEQSYKTVGAGIPRYYFEKLLSEL